MLRLLAVARWVNGGSCRWASTMIRGKGREGCVVLHGLIVVRETDARMAKWVRYAAPLPGRVPVTTNAVYCCGHDMAHVKGGLIHHGAGMSWCQAEDRGPAASRPRGQVSQRSRQLTRPAQAIGERDCPRQLFADVLRESSSCAQGPVIFW